MRVIRACLVLGLPVGLTLGGCVSWRPYEPAPSLSARQHLPTRLRTTRQDSTRLILSAPFIRGDTLYGRIQRDTVGVPIEEIAGLEWERLSAARTTGLLVGVPAGLVLIYAITCGDGLCGPTY